MPLCFVLWESYTCTYVSDYTMLSCTAGRLGATCHDIAASMELSTLNVVNALQCVSVEKTRALVFQLGVEDHVLDDITMQHDVTNLKTKFIQAWLNSDTCTSWEKLVSGLKQIKMNVVAGSVEFAFVPKTELPVPTTTSAPLSAATVSPIQPVTTPAQLEPTPVATIPVAPTPAMWTSG